jgi:NTE family protein
MRDSSDCAFVLGGGGVLGFAWTLGALAAVEREWEISASNSGLVVGTSAGSLLGALVGCGIEVDVIRRHHQGVPAPADPGIEWDYDHDSGGALPPRPGLRPGSPRLLFGAVRHPFRASPKIALSGLLPRGRGTLAPIHEMVEAAAGQGLDGATWPRTPRLWVVATDYDSGDRTIFGRDDISVTLADAVTASCAIPAWYSPVDIGGRLYIDGGTASNASVDAVLPLVEEGSISIVFILAPMASVEVDHPRSPMVRLERVVRRSITRGIQADAQRLRDAGATVVLLTPGPHDLEVMGSNLMNPRARTRVLETSLLTSASALRDLRIRYDIAGIADDPIDDDLTGESHGAVG